MNDHSPPSTTFVCPEGHQTRLVTATKNSAEIKCGACPNHSDEDPITFYHCDPCEINICEDCE